MSDFAKVKNFDDSVMEIRNMEDGFDPDTILINDGNSDVIGGSGSSGEDGVKKFGPTREFRWIPVVIVAAETPTATQTLVTKDTVEALRVKRQRVTRDLSATEIKEKDATAEGDKQRAKMSALFAKQIAGTPVTAAEQGEINLFLMAQAGVTE